MLLKHLPPLWEEGVKDGTPVLEKRTKPHGHIQIHILNATVVWYTPNYTVEIIHALAPP
jgi:hypothetical protein